MIPLEFCNLFTERFLLIAAASAIPPPPLDVAAAASFFQLSFLILRTFSFSSNSCASSEVDMLMSPISSLYAYMNLANVYYFISYYRNIVIYGQIGY